MARRWRLFDMRPDEPIEGIRMSIDTLFDEEILCWVRETVEGKLRSGGLTPIVMRSSRGYLSLGMRDVQASPPPVPEDAKQRAINRERAEAQKKKKDAEEAKYTRKILEREGLEKHHRQQRQDGLPVEASLSPSLSEDSSGGDDESEMGRGPLDHLHDVGETALGASVSSPALPGRGEDASGPVIARPGVEADTPEAQALGKRAVSLVGSTAKVEQVAVGAAQLPPRRVEGVPESGEDQPAPMDIEVVPPPPPPPFRKRHVEVPALAPHKVLKVSASSIAQGEHGAALAGADPKELDAQEEVAEAAMEQAEEEEPMAREAEAHESAGAEAPLVTEATEAEAPRTSEAEATEAEVPSTTEVAVAEAGAPGTTEARAAGDGVSAVKPAAQEVETRAGQALILPLIQGPPPP
ncbi:uncharacterized protein [Miscanthus floridulus]|uniref:uncharacterized protein n=1 Tax=Miscanthus floridulus TaxID=154761 RepID=UPI00345B4B6E